MKTKIIVNPMANKGNCGKRWPQLRAELENQLGALADGDIVTTRERNHATALAREAVDGGLPPADLGRRRRHLQRNPQRCDRRRPADIAPDLVLAQLPGGTSNEFCRSFGQSRTG